MEPFPWLRPGVAVAGLLTMSYLKPKQWEGILPRDPLGEAIAMSHLLYHSSVQGSPTYPFLLGDIRSIFCIWPQEGAKNHITKEKASSGHFS